MEVGVINVGSYHGGLKQFLKSLTENISSEASLIGIEFDFDTSQYVFKPLSSETTSYSSKQTFPELKSIHYKGDLANLFIHAIAKMAFSHIIVVGPVEEARYIQKLLHGVTKILSIPSSIYNDVPESDSTLGYDTALNSIVKSILQIKDTASSLVLKETRVFCIQIPGSTPGPLLHEVTIAVDGIQVIDTSSVELTDVHNQIIKRVERGDTYVFLLMHHEVDPTHIRENLSALEPLDFKVIKIDEAQCMGPYPSALDRVLAQKFVIETIDWVKEKKESGIFLYRNNRVLAKQLI
ncbi:hypothetical protein DS745_08305 [Anaerobacillus alkaliphilus]|uniref:Phosphofructokinase domain-containing protein n=1 Tax=Anaerobacillus alkaliphilus TaxID=1548597 RepID=A0A4V1LGK9_9BACI|nr:6-phosphofructokinase [Anaerobacillus alkaliphilus]RXJ02082.1 hypothetical protein DS745_08305 [Anaerobacillus alkaliphilus]